MANYSFIAKQKLECAIRKVCLNFSDFVNRPEKDFLRNRKVSFSNTLHFLLSLGAKSMGKEIFQFWKYSIDTPTESALIQARKKLKLTAFATILRNFNHTVKKDGKFHGYHLFAVDGSKFSFPENKKEPLCWTPNPNTEKGRNVLQLNALYHLRSGIFEDILFQNLHEINEHTALSEMLHRSRIASKFILMADRGYESYNTFAHIEQHGGYYVVRGRNGNKGILSGLELPDTEEFDEEISVIICKNNSKNVRENPKKYKRIRQGARFDFFTEKQTEYELNFRVIKVKVSETLTEILFTNLPKEEFSLVELKELYHMRWEIETAFSQLKYALGAVALHSRRAEFVKQEIYGKVILFNFSKSIMSQTKVEQKSNRKYNYKLNVRMGMEVCKKFWCSPDETAPIEELLLRYLVPIRDERHIPRKTTARSVIPFQNKIT